MHPDPAATRDFPLHVKKLEKRIHLEAVAALSGGAQSLADFKHASGWLTDSTRYNAVPVKGARGAPTTSMSDAWIDALHTHGVVVTIPRELINGWVHMFAVLELAKRRWRAIKHTRDANDVLGKETLMQLTFPTKTDICQLVHKGECFAAFDFSAFFDQFVYAPEIGARFCFRKHGRYFRLNTLAMGQRQAVEVAATTTARLLDFSPNCASAAVIDNVIFAGSEESVLADATTFVARCNAVGATLNEDVSTADAIKAVVATSGDWCGVHLDFAAKTASLTEKTLDKVAYSWERRETWTWRTFWAHVGRLFWAWQIIELPMADFFPLLRFVSKIGGWLATAPASCWDQPASIWSSVWPTLRVWTKLVLTNAPRRVPREQEPEWIVATDASEWGWGYFALHNTSGAVRAFGAPWSPLFRYYYGDRLGTSTFTEPQAIVNALCHLLPATQPTAAVILTDNTVAQASFGRGFNTHSFHINECLRRVQSIFGSNFRFRFHYLPGEQNPADGLSRGTQHSDALSAETRDQGCRTLRQASGVCQNSLQPGLAADVRPT